MPRKSLQGFKKSSSDCHARFMQGLHDDIINKRHKD
jgi:hypothetical protein